MKTLAEVVDELDDRSFRIADFLVRQGIKGDRDNCTSCPIAEYVLRATGARWADVTATEIEVAYRDGSAQVVETPEHVVDFIEDFDGGRYPELVRTFTADELLP